MKYNIFVKDKDRSKDCDEELSLMDNLYKYSNLVPNGCHNGACGVCKIKIHDGKFEKLKMNRKHISEEEEEKNIVLACKVFPKSEMEIEFLGNKPAKKNNTYILGS